MGSAINIGWLSVILAILFVLAGITIFIALIYVIVKRVKDKRAEDFEQRDH